VYYWIKPLIWFHLIVLAHLGVGGPASIHRVERALEDQVAKQVRVDWNVPTIAFGARGIGVYIEGAAAITRDCGNPDDGGCHAPADSVVSGAGAGVAIYALAQYGYSFGLDHEILEALADPTGDRTWYGQTLEICDPVQGGMYTLDGEPLSDFTYPRAWRPRSGGWRDWMHTTMRRSLMAPLIRWMWP
jgi:hypothetical protein